MSDELTIIVGLGNPGRKYEGSRHNIGFDVVDCLRERYLPGKETRFGRSLVIGGRIEGRRVLLVKPQTFMNLSGEAVREVADYYKADPETQVIVICDDIDLAPGTIRLRAKGSAGGHNGLKNIISHLGTNAFARIRVGVGAKPSADYDLADYVLGHFSRAVREAVDDAVQRAADAAVCVMTEGTDRAMTKYNVRPMTEEERLEKERRAAERKAANEAKRAAREAEKAALAAQSAAEAAGTAGAQDPGTAGKAGEGGE